MPATKGLSRSDIGTSDDYNPVVPADGADLAVETRYIIISVGGTIKLRKRDQTDVVLTLPAGIFPLRAVRVWATGTTATGITALT